MVDYLLRLLQVALPQWNPPDAVILSPITHSESSDAGNTATRAITRVIQSTAFLEAAYTDEFGIGLMRATELMLMMYR